MRYFIMMLMTIGSYDGVVTNVADHSLVLEVQVGVRRFVMVNVTISEWDSIKVGDTVKVSKRTYTLIN